MAREFRIGFLPGALFLILVGFLGGFSLCLAWQHAAQTKIAKDVANLAQDLDQCQLDRVLLARELVIEHNACLRTTGAEPISTFTVCVQGLGDHRKIKLLYTDDLCPSSMEAVLGPYRVLYDSDHGPALVPLGAR